MSVESKTCRPFQLHRVWLLYVCLLPTLITLTGCGGCRDWIVSQRTEREKSEEELLEDEKREKVKPDFERWRVAVLPASQPISDFEEDLEITEASEEDLEEGVEQPSFLNARRVAAKPGHWVQTRYRLKPNNFDFSGSLTLQCVDGTLAPRLLEQSSFTVTSKRSVILPQGQTKEVDLPVFVMVPTSRESRRVQFDARLKARGSGRIADQDITPTLRMRRHQYHFVVLSRNPDRYGWLGSTPAVRPPFGDWALDGMQEDYVVTFHRAVEDESVPLPSDALTWTSIAYLLWDDFPVDVLTPSQQTAFLDWLHWGGQLVISGPASLDSLRSSFLADYLPAESGPVTRLSPEAEAEINDTWGLIPQRTEFDSSFYRLDFAEGSRPEQLELKPVPPAQFVPGSAELVAERRVGRGRIVVTAFDLADRSFVNWRNFDGFFNSCLLRRPQREFYRASTGFASVRWLEFPLDRSDARLTTQLRYFSRDAKIPGEGIQRASIEYEVEDSTQRKRPATSMAEPTKFAAGHEGYRNDPISGVAGWSDSSAAAIAAKKALSWAAGISVPSRSFVVRVLGLYLVMLVPLNWAFFRVLRKVEWAWFAAPVLSIIGAIVVARMAQLDIGFVRSRTEIAIAETHAAYPRAHVTRYCGLYTSLSSRYDLTSDDRHMFALPLAQGRSGVLLASQQNVEYAWGNDAGLDGFPVISNSTGMVHVEQMIELPGTVVWVAEEGRGAVKNETEYRLEDAILVRQWEGRTEVADVGELPSGSAVEPQWQSGQNGKRLLALLDDKKVTRLPREEGELNLRDLYRLALEPAQLRPGDLRMVAWNDRAVKGIEISPGATQDRFRTVWVSHLQYGDSPQPQPDENHLDDFKLEDDAEVEEVKSQ